jgi:IS30 family transposase
MSNEAPNSGKDWTTQERDAMKIWAQLGLSTEQIAQKLGRTMDSVYDEASRHGITLMPRDKYK